MGVVTVFPEVATQVVVRSIDVILLLGYQISFDRTFGRVLGE